MSCQFAVVPFGVLPICCGPVWCPVNLLWSRLVSCQFVVVPFVVFCFIIVFVAVVILFYCCVHCCCILFYCCVCNVNCYRTPPRFIVAFCWVVFVVVTLRLLLQNFVTLCYLLFLHLVTLYLLLMYFFYCCVCCRCVFFYYYCLYCCYILFYCLQRQLLSHTPKVIPPCMQCRPPVYNESESHICLVFCRSLCYLSSNGVLCIFYVPAVHNFTRSCRLPLLYDVTGFWRSWIHCEKTRN